MREGEELTNSKLELLVPSCLANLSLIRQMIRNFLQFLNIPIRDQVHLLQAVDELSTNAIEHAYSYYEKGDIKIMVVSNEDEISLSVEDFGKGYNSKENNSKPEGGMGLEITKKLVDEFIITNKIKGTMITIKKKIKEAEGSEHKF